MHSSQTTKNSSLFSLWSMYFEDGSSLSLDQWLYWSFQPSILFHVYGFHGCWLLFHHVIWSRNILSGNTFWRIFHQTFPTWIFFPTLFHQTEARFDNKLSWFFFFVISGSFLWWIRQRHQFIWFDSSEKYDFLRSLYHHRNLFPAWGFNALACQVNTSRRNKYR